MRQWGRRICLVVGGLLLLAVAVPYLVPAQKYKQLLEEKLTLALGRAVTMNELSVVLLPYPSLRASHVRIANPSWAEGQLAELEELTLNVQWKPLLQGNLRINAITLKSPVIMLLTKGSDANWELPAFKNREEERGASHSEDKSQAKNAMQIGINTITISHGNITSQGQALLTDVNLTLHAPSPDKAIDVAGDMTFKGQRVNITLLLDRQAALPAVSGDIHIPVLGVSQLAGNSAPAAKEEVSPPVTPAAHTWNDAPFSLAALKKLTASMTLTIDELRYAQMSIHDIVMPVTLENGTALTEEQASLRAKTNDIKMYGGTFALETHLQSNNTIGVAFFAKQLDMGPLLKDATGNDRMQGKLTSTIALGGHGGSLRAIISTLGGHGDIAVNDGAVKGLNLIALANIAAVARGEQIQDQSTKFSSLTASFVMPNNGVMHNEDLALTSPLLAAHGAGNIDLPAWNIGYTVVPQLNGTAIKVPVHIDGVLDHPNVHVDAQPSISDIIKHPEKLKADIKQIKNNLLNKDSLKQLLGR